MNRPLLALLAAAALTTGACSSGGSDAASTTTTTEATQASTTTSSTPEPIDDQTPPQSINGITVQGDTVWAATISGDEVLQIRIEDGAILGRYPTDGAGPDDVAVAPDGSVWVTGFGNGDIGRVANGSYERVSGDIAMVNPLEFGADGILYLGTFGPDGSLYSLETDQGAPIDGTSPVVIAEGTMPDINGFAVLADGTIFSPAGGVGGPGSAIVIDPATGEFTTVVDGLPAVAAGTADPDGNPYLLANVTGEVIAIDVEAGTSEVIHTISEGAPFDNLAFGADGSLYLSSFIAPTITEVQPDGTVRVITVGT